MVDTALDATVGNCGLVCGVCKNIEKGCQGCRSGGGADDCYQRRCCLERNIDGCWQCDIFPCDKGFFDDEEWKGLCIGFVKCIKAKGIEKFVSLVESKLGKLIEYGEFRFRNEQEIVTMLRGTNE